MNFTFNVLGKAGKRPMTFGEIKIIKLVFSVIGVTLLSVGVYKVADFFYRQATWADYPAKVLSADMASRQDSDNDTQYKVVVRYQYEHPQTKKMMTGMFGGDYETSLYSEAQKMLLKYSPGAQISVKMNPKNSLETTVFLPMSLMVFYILAFIGAVFIVVAQLVAKSFSTGVIHDIGLPGGGVADIDNLPEGETIQDFNQVDGTRVIRRVVKKIISSDRNQFAVSPDKAGEFIQAIKDGRDLGDIDSGFSDSSANDKLYKE